jgi:Uncharacterized protein conserved in bacteria
MGQTGRPAAGQQKRMANYELLRILSMLMVITLHYLSHTGSLLTPGEAAQGRQVLGTLIESFCIVAVNVYVLISGYFLVEAGFRLKRILVLVGQVLFYALAVPLVMLGLGNFNGEAGLYQMIPYVFPLQAEHYWFATSYVLLYLFTPFLNTAVKHMGKRQMQIALAGLLLLFSIEKSVIPAVFVTDRFGYDFGWFLCVYLLAAYIRLYGFSLLNTAKRAWSCYICCGLFLFAAVTVSYLIHEKTGALAYYTTVPFHYNYIFCLLGAAALFAAFGYVKIPAGKAADRICRLSAFTFGVYLFHEHLDIRNVWVGWIEEFLGPVSQTGLAGFLGHLVISVALVYAAGTFVDAVRLNIFRFTGRYLSQTRPAGWIRKLDEYW